MASKYKAPPVYKAPPQVPSFKTDKQPDDWSKPKTKTPLEQHAYNVGMKTKPANENTAPKITNRVEYHQASSAFHEGRANNILSTKPANNSPEAKQLGFHQQAAAIHNNAAATHSPSSPFHSAYPQHLSNLQSHYKAMEEHATKNNMKIGSGETRYVTK